MHITMLGTGSADGWPNPFCDCTSCQSMRAAGEHRAPSSALIDGCLLIDCGPTAPHAAGRAGISLSKVEHVLITHGHPDHLYPAFLLSWQWSPPGHRLQVWGPQHAIDSCRDWLAEDATVDLHVINDEALLDLRTAQGTYRVQAIAAAHSHGNGDVMASEALLYAIQAPDGQRALYGTDTAVLPEESLRSLDGRFDAVLLDATFGNKSDHQHGHLDLTTLPVMAERLRDFGLVDESTTLVAIHLSHFNPPKPELDHVLTALGFVVVDDLDTIDTRTTPLQRGRLVLITGGARSGKSSFAEQLAASYPHVDYIATGGTRAGDAEWTDRIMAHQERRPSHWTTHETRDIASTLARTSAGNAVLIDCLSLWLTGELDDLDAWSDNGFSEYDPRLTARVAALTKALQDCPADVFIVTNEVGDGIVPDNAGARLFRDCLGRLNARIADVSDDAFLVIAGRPLRLPPTEKSQR